jgi:hypothetical protein
MDAAFCAGQARVPSPVDPRGCFVLNHDVPSVLAQRGDYNTTQDLLTLLASADLAQVPVRVACACVCTRARATLDGAFARVCVCVRACVHLGGSRHSRGRRLRVPVPRPAYVRE